MRSEEHSVRTQLKILLDSLAIAAAFFAAYHLRKPFDMHPFQPLAPVREYLWILTLSYSIWWVSLIFTGIYSNRTIPWELRTMMQCVLRAWPATIGVASGKVAYYPPERFQAGRDDGKLT